jgi:hypothetical protein
MGNYAAALATPRPHLIYQSTFSKQPINTAIYVELRAQLKQALFATKWSLKKNNLPDKDVNFSPLPFDQTLRAFPIIPANKESEAWLHNTLKIITVNEAEFRMWSPGEEPTDHAMEIYLNTDFDCMEVEQAIELIKDMNRGIPLNIGMIGSVEPQTDRFGTPKGRLIVLMAPKALEDYCELRGYKLAFLGEQLTCISQVEKARRLAVQANEARLRDEARSREDAAGGNRGGRGGARGFGRRPAGSESEYNKRPRL